MRDELHGRPTPDLIVMLLAGVVAICVLFLAGAVIVSSLWYPDHDITSLTQRIGTIISSLIGAIVGYLAGRGVNGKNGGSRESAGTPTR